MTTKKFIVEYINNYVDVELPIARALSVNSFASYMITLKQFMIYASEKRGEQSAKILSSSITFDMIRGFLIDGKQALGWGRSTYNLKLAGIRAFVRYLGLVDPAFLDLSRRVSLLHGQTIPKTRVDYITEDQILPVIDFNPKSFIELRDKTIILFMFYTGCRISELTDLEWSSLKWKSSKTLHISIIGKGRKERKLPLHNSAISSNLKDIETHNSEWGCKHIFSSRENGKMSNDNVRRIVKKYLAKQFPKLHLTPHSLRHSAAMNWLSKGIDIYTISALLGHETVATTEHYLKSRFESHEAKLSEIENRLDQSRRFKTKFKSNDAFIESLNLKIKNCV